MKRLPYILFSAWWLFLFLLHATPLRAQASLSFSMQHYTDENGLPQNSVTQLSFDDAGFLWFSTSMGLVRFDGLTFTVWEKKHLGFEDPVIRHVVFDPPTRRLYVVGRSKGLGIITKGKFIHLSPGISDTRLSLDAVPLKYLYGHVLPYAFHGDHYSYVIPAGNATHYRLKADSLTMYQDAKEQFTVRLPGNEIQPWRFFVVGNRLYHLDQRGNIRHYGKESQNVNIKGDLPKNNNYRKGGNEIRPIVNSTTGDVFIYLENALYLIEEDSSRHLTSRLILTGFDFSDYAVSSICYDRKNERIFIGSYTDGLYVFKRKQFLALSMEEMMGDNTGNSYLAQVAYGKDKSLTSGGSVFGINGVENHLDEFAELSDRTSVLRDYQGNIFSKKISDLYRWDSQAKKLKQSWDVGRIISVMYASRDSSIWLGTITPGGLYRLDLKDENARPERLVPSLPDVTYITETQTGIIWVATESGLYMLNKNSGNIQAVQEFKNKPIRGLYTHASDSGAVWVYVADEGIYLYRNEKSHPMPRDHGNFTTDVKCMLLDSSGYFWITTGKGLFRVFRQDFIDYADGKKDRVYYFYYSKSNGFNTNEFSGSCEPCGIALENGYFSFPSLNGLVWFRPNEIKAEYPDGEIYIDRVVMDGKNVYPDSVTYHLKRNFKRLAIYYTSPYYGSRHNLNFETRLDDEDWLPVTSNPIIFTSFPAGKHNLQIRKINGSGEAAYSVQMIQLEVPPAYWQTGWFILLCILGLGAIVYTYTRVRIIYIERTNAMLEESISERTQELKQTIHALKESKEIISRDAELQKRLTASIAHDVKTPLKYLLLTAGSLSKIPPQELNNEQETIKTVYRSLYRIYHFTDNLLAYIKSSFNEAEKDIRDAIHLRRLVQEKVDIFNDVAASHSTVIENNIDEDILFLSNKNLLSVVIHNIIDNAVKFTFNGKISIDARIKDKEIAITVSDNGVGIHPEQMESIQAFLESEDQKWTPGYNKHNGLGLVIIKEVVKQLGGSIVMDSEKDMGTTVIVYLKE